MSEVDPVMPQTSKPPGLSRFGTIFFICCFLLVLFGAFLIFRPFFNIIVWASVLAVVFAPLHGRVLRLVRGRRAAASFVSCILVLLLIVLPLTVLGTMITRQSIALYHGIQDNLGSMPGDAAARIQEFQDKPALRWVREQAGRWLGLGEIDIAAYGRQMLSAASRWVVSAGPTVLAGFGGLVFNFMLVFITMFFLFRDAPAILEFVRTSTPLPAAYGSEIARKFRDVSYATFYGSILTAIVQGASAAVLFWALRVPSPLFWGAIVSFVSLVPIVGALLVWLPMTGYFLMIGETTRAVLLLVLGSLVVSSIDNVLKPMIIRGRTDMHPLLVFLSVLGGMQIFGFLGILLGPLIVAILLSFLNFYRLEFIGD